MVLLPMKTPTWLMKGLGLVEDLSFWVWSGALVLGLTAPGASAWLG